MTIPAPIFDADHRLSLNFTLREFTASQTAVRRGIRNVPTAEHIRNMEALCREVLEPVRAQFGHPVRFSAARAIRTAAGFTSAIRACAIAPAARC
ncbi:MAG: D-Ala-D-Ala carboxypeptidase family metallohydrolase [Paracoccaceae bacterium]|nr:D-Ala-D-Ala carboxypeptidase family metallohydrolase [Paracoccaceae bacterium]